MTFDKMFLVDILRVCIVLCPVTKTHHSSLLVDFPMTCTNDNILCGMQKIIPSGIICVSSVSQTAYLMH